MQMQHISELYCSARTYSLQNSHNRHKNVATRFLGKESEFGFFSNITGKHGTTIRIIGGDMQFMNSSFLRLSTSQLRTRTLSICNCMSNFIPSPSFVVTYHILEMNVYRCCYVYRLRAIMGLRCIGFI